MTTIVLALVAALAYGVADFIGGISSKRAGAWAVAMIACFGGSAGAAVLALVLGGDPGPGDYGWAVAAGLGNGLGTAFLYRGLSRGRMAVVAPVSAVGAALVPVVVGVGLGERPAPLVLLGMVIALPAIWLVAGEGPPGDDRGPSGLVDGIVAGLGFGSLWALLAQVPASAGLAPLALNQFVAGLCVLALAIALGEWRPRHRAAGWGVLSGLLGTLGTGAFLAATHAGLLSVAGMISGLYPAGTVLLAYAVLREHIHRTQALGLALAVVALALVAGG